MNESIYKFCKDDAIRFATERGAKVKSKGNELQFYDCPYCHGASHGDKYTFSINLNNGMYKCLRASCSRSGNMITLSKDFDFSLGREVDEYFKELSQYKRLVQGKINSRNEAIEYLRGRGISEEITKRYEISVSEKQPHVLVFPFRDDNGIMQYVKYRNTKFQKGDRGSKEWCETNCRPILFGMNQCNFENKTLIMTEGQIDSLSVSEAGFENAVSVPTGKNGFTWVPHCWNFLCKFDTLIVFGDHEHNEITLLKDMKTRFNGTVKHVRPEDYKDCKDANEILQKYGAEQITECIKNAIPLPIKSVFDMSEIKTEAPTDVPKLPTGIKAIDDTLHGGIPFGGVCILGGKRGDGKSTFGSQLIASALENNYSCLIYSGELLKEHVRAMLDSQLCRPDVIMQNAYKVDGIPLKWSVSETNRNLMSGWYQGRCCIYDPDEMEDGEREDILITIEKVIKQNGVKVILLDNLMTVLGLTLIQCTDKYEKQSQFVKELAKLARKYKVCIILVSHKRKSNNTFYEDTNDEISGSADITNLAGLVLSYDRLSKKDYDDGRGTSNDRKLIISKDRLFGNVNFDGIILHYNQYSKRIYITNEELNKKYGWEESFNPFL